MTVRSITATRLRAFPQRWRPFALLGHCRSQRGHILVRSFFGPTIPAVQSRGSSKKLKVDLSKSSRSAHDHMGGARASDRELPCSSLLPAPAECPVKLHETLILVASRLRERQFRGK